MKTLFNLSKLATIGFFVSMIYPTYAHFDSNDGNELYARDLDGLDPRDLHYDNDLYARDPYYDDDLYARDLFHEVLGPRGNRASKQDDSKKPVDDGEGTRKKKVIGKSQKSNFYDYTCYSCDAKNVDPAKHKGHDIQADVKRNPRS